MRKSLRIFVAMFGMTLPYLANANSSNGFSLTQFRIDNGPIVRLYAANGSVQSGAWDSDARLKTLVRDLHPSVYMAEGVIKVREQRPVCLFLDATSVAAVEPKTFARGSIELITIDVRSLNEISQRLDLSSLRGLGQLRYVHVRSSVLCQPEQLFAMVQNIPAHVKVLVTVEEPS
jgi:hypothetical protein